MNYVYLIMFYNEENGLYDRLVTIFKNENKAYKWISNNAIDIKNYKVECWSVK